MARSGFLKDVGTLITGTTAAQAIPVLIAPILTRLFTPEQFGLFALFLSLSGMISVLATGRYELTIVLPEKEEDAAALTSTGISIAFVFSLFLSIVCLLLGNQICELLGATDLLPWLPVVPLAVFLLATYQCLHFWLIRQKAFKNAALNKVVHRAGEGANNIATGYLASFNGLILGDLLGRGLMNLAAIWQIRNAGFPSTGFEKGKMTEQTARYSEYPKFNLLPAFMNSASFQLPVLIITQFFTVQITGFFNLTRQVLGAPLALISKAISEVLFERIAKRKNAGQPVFKAILKVVVSLAVPSVAGSAILIFFAPEIFSFVFGIEWTEAGKFCSILAGAYAIRFVVTPVNKVFPALDKIKWLSAWQVFYFFGICALWLFGTSDVYNFLYLYATIDVVAYSIYLLLVLKIANQHDKNLAASS